MTDGRKRPARVLAALCTTTLVAAVGGSFVAAPSYAKPDVQSVQTRVDSLYHQAEQASERYNQARIRLGHARTRLTALRADLAREQAKVDAVRSQVAASVVAQSQGQGISSAGQVLLARDPDAFLAQLSTISQLDDQQTQLMADFAAQADRLDLRREAAEREVRSIADTQRQLGTQKAEIDVKAAAAKKLLATLKQQAARQAAQQAARRAAARASRSAVRTAPAAPGALAATSAPAPAPAPAASVPASGRAAAAVRYAMAQIGKAYVFGAAGPSAFDCSGLTMMAWQQAGVSLPHSAAAQMSMGRPVSQSQLQPGDLVFYYSPVSHVGMYIGHGQIVNAENPSVGVKVTGVNTMPYAGAVRPG